VALDPLLGQRFRFRDPGLHGGLNFLESTDLDLANPLAGNSEFVGQGLERHWIIGKPPRLENTPFARVQDAERIVQGIETIVALLPIGQGILLACAIIDKPILPFAFAFLAQRRIERGVADIRRFMSITSCSLTPSGGQ